MLDWLGDMGGLLDALYIIGISFMTPLSTFALKSKMLSTMFRFRKSDKDIVLRRSMSQRMALFKKKIGPNLDGLGDD